MNQPPLGFLLGAPVRPSTWTMGNREVGAAEGKGKPSELSEGNFQFLGGVFGKPMANHSG